MWSNFTIAGSCLTPLDGDALHLHDVGHGGDGGGRAAAPLVQVLLGEGPVEQTVTVLIDAVHCLQVQPVVLPVQLPCNQPITMCHQSAAVLRSRSRLL